MYTGEQPIFSTKAHVFHMDQETRKIWIQISKHAASVHFYYDSARSTYRIISVEDSKAVVNSTVTPNMTFTKTSLKFGQWSDPQASTVYGLGFSCEQELTRFHECFEEVKELTKKALQAKAEVNGCREESSVMLEHPSPIRQFSHHRTSSLSSIPVSASSSQERRGSFSSSATSLPSNSTEAQMKYENDRLKIALAQSSSNAKKWEIELQTLKNNNVRLTTALQESTTNVEEWKKQLAAYKDENLRLRKMIQEKDNVAQSSDQTDTLQQDLSSRLQQLQLDSSQKQEEIDNLHQRIKELSGAEAINATLKAKIQKLDDVNRDLAQKVDDLQCLLQDTTSNHEKENWEILDLQGKLGNKISEIYEIHELVISSLKKESQS